MLAPILAKIGNHGSGSLILRFLRLSVQDSCLLQRQWCMYGLLLIHAYEQYVEKTNSRTEASNLTRSIGCEEIERTNERTKMEDVVIITMEQKKK